MCLNNRSHGIVTCRPGAQWLYLSSSWKILQDQNILHVLCVVSVLYSSSGVALVGSEGLKPQSLTILTIVYIEQHSLGLVLGFLISKNEISILTSMMKSCKNRYNATKYRQNICRFNFLS